MMVNKEISLLSQKDRCKWLEEGYNNSKYFHSRIRWRRIKSEIKGIEVQRKRNGEDPNI